MEGGISAKQTGLGCRVRYAGNDSGWWVWMKLGVTTEGAVTNDDHVT